LATAAPIPVLAPVISTDLPRNSSNIGRLPRLGAAPRSDPDQIPPLALAYQSGQVFAKAVPCSPAP
jgi:hypothetical protein